MESTRLIAPTEATTQFKNPTPKLVLVQEGIFPITRDHQGNALTESPNTGWSHAGTIQGEGKLAGVPSLFIRLAACNLRCIWQMDDGSLCRCDTAYASFHTGKTISADIDDVMAVVGHNLNNIRHVVITGGEPMLQANALTELCKRLKAKNNVHITLETNGTLFDQHVASYIDLVSLSPKLNNATPTIEKTMKEGIDFKGTFRFHEEIRKNTEVIQQWISHSKQHGNDFQLKFVVSHVDEAQEIKLDFLNHLTGWHPSDVMLMPLGANPEQLHRATELAVKMAVQQGWRFAPRLHIDLWGNKTGV
jgi:7-carboxy-7-deazaguanine synthase